MAKILYVQLLTTGRVPRLHGVYTIAFIMEINGEVVDSIHLPVALFPKNKVNKDRLLRANLTDADLSKFPEPKTVYRDMIAFLSKHIKRDDKKDKAFLAGFDVAKSQLHFLQEFMFECSRDPSILYDFIYSSPIDVFVIAAHILMEERIKMAGFGIGHVAGRFGVDFDINMINDATYVLNVVREIHKKMKI